MCFAEHSPASSDGEPPSAAQGNERGGDTGATGKAAAAGREDWMTKPMGRSVVAAPAEKEEKEADAKPAVSVRVMPLDIMDDAQCCLRWSGYNTALGLLGPDGISAFRYVSASRV